MDRSRVVLRQERSTNQAPTDISGVRHISTLKHTSYKERTDDNHTRYGQKNIDESNIIKRVSTYQ